MMSFVSRVLPWSVRTNRSFLKVMGPVGGGLLGVGRFNAKRDGACRLTEGLIFGSGCRFRLRRASTALPNLICWLAPRDAVLVRD